MEEEQQQQKLEPPECPVCLTQYDAVRTIPRVLPCGHTTCQPCLSHLPNPFPNTIRCPSCTHLVKFPNCPSSLPKNFDLLRFSSIISVPKKVISPPTNDDDHIRNEVSLVPNLFPREFYVSWIKWILPNVVVLVEPPPGKGTNDEKIVNWTYSKGAVRCAKLPLCNAYSDNNSCYDNGNKKSNEKSLFGCLLRDNEEVGLVKVGSFVREKGGNGVLKYSYEVKILDVLYGIGDRGRDEIRLLLNASLRLGRMGNVFGFWCNEDDSVYMVCESFSRDLAKVMEGLECGFTGESLGERLTKMGSFGMVGMEMCEAVSSFHLGGLVIGCLSLSCFGLNDFGRVNICFSEVVEMGTEVCRLIADWVLSGGKSVDEDLKMRLKNDILETKVFLSPEAVFNLLRKEGVEFECGSSTYEVCGWSDLWSLACLLVWLLTGKPFIEEMCNYYMDFVLGGLTNKKNNEWLGRYTGWMEKIKSLLERTLDLEFLSLKETLCKCFEFNPENRPSLIELWRYIRESVSKTEFDVIVSVKVKLPVAQNSRSYCVILGELFEIVAKRTNKRSIRHRADGFQKKDENSKAIVDEEGKSWVDSDVGEGVSGDHVKCIDLKGHLDSISGLAVGEGFLFSSSYDKAVNVWSLQDFSHVHSFKGHEHRVMAIVYVDGESLCISADYGGVICIWSARIPLGPEPIRKLNEEKDWRYSGIHALAASGTEYFYTGSGDKTIKAWSLQDYTLSCTMSGHRSVVSSLAVSGGVLYSGSWDGTVRLWCLSDHSPLAVLGDGKPGNVISVFSLAADCNVVVVAHENGCIKIWHNDALLKSERAHNGAIFAIIKIGKWIFAGGWDKAIIVQELSGDEAQLEAIAVGSIPCGSTVTALAYWQGKLFAGQADGVIKVYYSRF